MQHDWAVSLHDGRAFLIIDVRCYFNFNATINIIYIYLYLGGMSDRFVQVDPRAFSGDNDFADIMTNGSTLSQPTFFAARGRNIRTIC